MTHVESALNTSWDTPITGDTDGPVSIGSIASGMHIFPHSFPRAFLSTAVQVARAPQGIMQPGCVGAHLLSCGLKDCILCQGRCIHRSADQETLRLCLTEMKAPQHIPSSQI